MLQQKTGADTVVLEGGHTVRLRRSVSLDISLPVLGGYDPVLEEELIVASNPTYPARMHPGAPKPYQQRHARLAGAWPTADDPSVGNALFNGLAPDVHEDGSGSLAQLQSLPSSTMGSIGNFANHPGLHALAAAGAMGQGGQWLRPTQSARAPSIWATPWTLLKRAFSGKEHEELAQRSSAGSASHGTVRLSGNGPASVSSRHAPAVVPDSPRGGASGRSLAMHSAVVGWVLPEAGEVGHHSHSSSMHHSNSKLLNMTCDAVAAPDAEHAGWNPTTPRSRAHAAPGRRSHSIGGRAQGMHQSGSGSSAQHPVRVSPSPSDHSSMQGPRGGRSVSAAQTPALPSAWLQTQSAQGMLQAPSHGATPPHALQLHLHTPSLSDMSGPGSAGPCSPASPGDGKRLLSLSMRMLRTGLRARKGSLIYPYPGVSPDDIDPGLHVLSKPVMQPDADADAPLPGWSSAGMEPAMSAAGRYRGVMSAGQTQDQTQDHQDLLPEEAGIAAVSRAGPVPLTAPARQAAARGNSAYRAAGGPGHSGVKAGGTGAGSALGRQPSALRSVLSDPNMNIPGLR